MQPAGDGHIAAAPERLGKANDIVKAISQIDIGEDAPLAAGFLHAAADRVSLAAVVFVAHQPHAGRPVIDQRLQTFDRVVGAAVTYKENFPRSRAVRQELAESLPGGAQAGSGV